MKEHERFSYVYDRDGFIVKDFVIRDRDAYNILFLEFDVMKRTYFCKVFISEIGQTVYVRLDSFEVRSL